MDTFTEPKALTANPRFSSQKEKIVGMLMDDMIDKPIVDLVNGFNRLPYCFTLQSCYGHFVYDDNADPYNIEPLPESPGKPCRVEYRIAYMAFCIDNSDLGNKMLEALASIAAIAPNHIQFGCVEWFWDRQVNSYALQVAPTRSKQSDTAIIDFKDALMIEKTRNAFFTRLFEMLESCVSGNF